MLKKKKLVVIGGGKMGEVITGAVVGRQLAAAQNVTVTDVVAERLKYLKGKFGVVATADNKASVKKADVVILAVKPQSMAEVLQGISGEVTADKLLITIAAGIPIKFIMDQLGKSARVIRVMPNTPALIGEGAAALAKGGNATDEDLELAKHIFDSVGITVVVKEDLMDAVTGLSGSGPAYVFTIIDALSDGGVLMGLSRDVAVKLSAQTLLGAARLCLQSGKHPGELRDMVTSPGGTTIAGLKAMEEGALRSALIRAVEAATLRSKELGKGK
ncbi:MAG TPA: pyrroline-5-carboxylate reductase [Syntrophales bacterium]|nr:pyrroline-5-carboxylate reductase [Syntrophales bacterium]